LIGVRNELLTETRGTAIYNHIFKEYVPYKGKVDYYKRGAIISMEDGAATGIFDILLLLFF
jgi:GTP-binding protein